jgi:diguanylate cyclase (GGDEF)-like protein
VVDHFSSAKCTAINSTLAALAMARSDVLTGEPEQERAEPQWAEAVGVLTAGTWTLEDFHSGGVKPSQAIASLSHLPRESLLPAGERPVPRALEQAPPALRDAVGRHDCSLGYGLRPEAVRIYPIADPTGRKGSGGSGSWFALLYGPWNQGGQRKSAFALVNLNAITFSASGHDGHRHGWEAILQGGKGAVGLAVDLQPPAVLGSRLDLHRLMPDLAPEDHKLLGLRIIPFANQFLRAELSVDHRKLDRLARRTGSFVFLMGLLSTSAVVLISRRTELKLRRLNRALLQESRTDGLTRLANRRAWDEALQREEGRRQRHGHRYGLVVVDLDGFKRINDARGHQMGDQVLQAAAAGMAAVLRETDLLARVGGDEFAVLSFNPTPEGLRGLQERLQQALEQAGIQASIGVALSRGQATLEQTWAEADGAMYHCKSGQVPADPASSPPDPHPFRDPST